MRILFLICVLVFCSCEKTEKSNSLVASIENCKIIGPNGISLDFVLTNNSKQTILLYERWNMWGADQWVINVKDADGDTWEFSNPQAVWIKNFPSTFKIAPSDKYVITCILNKGQVEPQNHLHVFTSSNTKTLNRYPLIISGSFISKIDKTDSWEGKIPNWEGSITSEKVIVK